jgi:hypothetical protein
MIVFFKGHINKKTGKILVQNNVTGRFYEARGLPSWFVAELVPDTALNLENRMLKLASVESVEVGMGVREWQVSDVEVEFVKWLADGLAVVRWAGKEYTYAGLKIDSSLEEGMFVKVDGRKLEVYNV